jgi:hypothetical protein
VREREHVATGITAYLGNGGKLEIAQQIAAHESSLGVVEMAWN